MVPLSTSPSTAKAFQSRVTRSFLVPGVASSGDCSGASFLMPQHLTVKHLQYGAGRGKQGLFCGTGSGRGHSQAHA